MDDLISIIVPVYNSSMYLEECLNSLIKQSYKNIEIILIDDGSTDDSGNICDIFSKKDNRITVYHTKNNGQSAARNFGISKAIGKYLSFVDSDDYVDEDFILFLYSNLIKYNVNISCCGYTMFYPNNVKKNKNKKNISKKLSKEEAIKYLIVNGMITDSPCNKLFDKNLFSSISFPINQVYEDRRLLPVIFYNSDFVYYDSTAKYYYRQHSNSTTHDENKLYQLIDATKERKIFIDEKFPELKDYTTQDLIISYLTVSNFLILNVNYKKYSDLCNEVKKLIQENNYTYKSLKLSKKIQLYIYIKMPKIYMSIIKLLKNKE